MKEKIRECLLHLQDLPNIKAKLAEAGSEEAFAEALDSVVNELTEPYNAELIKELAEGNPVELQVEDAEEFQNCQDLATKVYNEWNESAVRLAIAAYLESGKKINLYSDGDKNLTYGELFGLDTSDELAATEAPLTAKKRDSLPDSVFCGPNRSFPVHDRAHAIAALRLLNRYAGAGDKKAIEACVVKKAAKFGVGPRAKGESVGLVDFYPVLVEGLDELVPLFNYQGKEAALYDGYSFTTEQNTLVEAFTNSVENLVELANSDEFFTNFTLFDTEEVSPLVLKEDFLFNYFKANEKSNSKEREYLLQLVGISRTLKLSKKEIEEAANPYKIFGNTVLGNLLDRLPNEKVEEKTPEKSDDESEEGENPPTEVIPNPVQNKVPTPSAGKTFTEGQWVDMMCKKPERVQGTTKRNPRGKGTSS